MREGDPVRRRPRLQLRLEQRGPICPAIFNHDGAADAANFIVGRKGVGVAPTPDNYNLWQTNFAATLNPGSGASTVNESSDSGAPELTSVVLLLLAASGVLALPRFRGEAKNRC